MSEHESPIENEAQPSNKARRDLLLGIGAATAVAYTGSAAATMPGHDHSKHSPQNPDLLDATNDCLDKGQRCIAHCLTSFREGDLEMADCASKVHEMQAICGAFSYLLAANSEYVKDTMPSAKRPVRTVPRNAESTINITSAGLVQRPVNRPSRPSSRPSRRI